MPRPVPLARAALEELAERFGTPLQLYDEAGIRANVRQLLAAGARSFGAFREYFAVKALPNPSILRMLLDEGCGLDCSSAAELELAAVSQGGKGSASLAPLGAPSALAACVQRLGVPGDRVMFTSNYTSREDLRRAWEQGVTINLDDASLVQSLADAAGPSGAFPALISFRLNPGLGRTDSETRSNVLGGPGAKFGVPAEDLAAAYRSAKAAGARRFGIHMMTGSCVLSDEYWLEAVRVLLATMGRVQREAGITFEFVNLGGGLGIPYRAGDRAVDVASLFDALGAELRRGVAEHGLAVGEGGLQVCMENGRFVTGPFGWLVARVQAEKRAFGQRYLGLDASMANLMRPAMYGAYHEISVPARQHTPPEPRAAAADTPQPPPPPLVGYAPVHVVGTLCENNDWFAKDRLLPADVAVGDLLVIHDTGAHGHAMGFQYNGKLRAPEVLLRPDGSALLIRRGETFDDLFATAPPLPHDGTPAPASREPTTHDDHEAHWALAAGFFGLAVAASALATAYLRSPSTHPTPL